MHLKVCVGTEDDVEKSKGGDEPHDLLSVLSHSLLPRHLRRYWKSASGPRQLGQLLCCLRRFQRLGLYTRCFLMLALGCLFIALCGFIQISEPSEF